MGASRKLQGEIDRVLKKVQEGVDVFDSIWNKVYDTENANQKEKFEADLKKEIKKLQRYRDQIKTWTQSSEIKDKKVSASYEQALMDARKLIEREMERFKVCEKETKTKAFSKEGLGQQPKTDPEAKPSGHTVTLLNPEKLNDEWKYVMFMGLEGEQINSSKVLIAEAQNHSNLLQFNMFQLISLSAASSEKRQVGDLESQIDNFEAELEGLSVRKGKTRPPRLTHLEASITRHKAHIMKMELILRLLDNDELSPDQVNDVKDFLEDYVERNQDNFDEFSDVDELYSTLPLDKVEALEDLVALGPSNLVKTALSSTSPAALDPSEEAAIQDVISEIPPKSPPSKSGALNLLVPGLSSTTNYAMPTGSASPASASIPIRPLVGGPTSAAILSSPITVRGIAENSAAAAATAAAASSLSSSLLNPSASVKDDDNVFPGRRSSPAIPEIGLGRGISRGIPNQSTISAPMSLGSVSGISSSGSLGSVSAISDTSKRNLLSVDERIGNGPAQPLVSPVSNRMLQQVSQNNDGTGSNDSNSVSEIVGGRVFSPSAVSGIQWRPPSAASFQNQNEMGPLRDRPEIAPDQREKFLQRLQQVQQQGHSSLLSVPHLPGANNKQFSSQQQSSLLQQLNSPSSSLSPQVGPGLNVQSPSLGSVASAVQQQHTQIHQQMSPHPLISMRPNDSDVGNSKIEEQQRQNFSDDSNVEPATSTAVSKVINDDDLKPYAVTSPAPTTEGPQLPSDTDFSPGQPLQPNQPSSSLGVIGRRSVSDLGTIGDNLSVFVGNAGGMHGQTYNMQMLEAAFHNLPQPKDSERVKSYVPRHPAGTPASYPQNQAPIVDNPAFWDQLGLDPVGTDTLFFAFYYQQNTYQQYLAAKELKRHSWRFHKKYNTWFQRHEEPQVTTDEYEKGTYVYFDFHITDDGSQHGWCQRIKNEFTFEYNFLEDDLVP